MAGRQLAVINNCFYLYIIDNEKTSANAASNAVTFDPTSSEALLGAFREAMLKGYDVELNWKLGAVDSGIPSVEWGIEYQDSAGIWWPLLGALSFPVVASSTGDPILIEKLPPDIQKLKLVMTDGGNLSASHDHLAATLLIKGKIANYTGRLFAKTALS